MMDDVSAAKKKRMEEAHSDPIKELVDELI